MASFGIETNSNPLRFLGDHSAGSQPRRLTDEETAEHKYSHMLVSRAVDEWPQQRGGSRPLQERGAA
jgi:hypothetical protein